MKHHYLAHKNRAGIFIFGLMQQFAPPEGIKNKNSISDAEFFGTLAMIILALVLLKLIFK